MAQYSSYIKKDRKETELGRYNRCFCLSSYSEVPSVITLYVCVKYLTMHIVMHSQADTKVSEGGDVCERKRDLRGNR